MSNVVFSHFCGLLFTPVFILARCSSLLVSQKVQKTGIEHSLRRMKYCGGESACDKLRNSERREDPWVNARHTTMKI
jgi:hypothetical protein